MWESTPAGAEQMVLWAASLAAFLTAAWWLTSIAAWTWSLRHDRWSLQGDRCALPNDRAAPPSRWVMPGTQRLARALLGPSVLVAGLATGCTNDSDPEVPTLVWVDEPTTVPPTTPATTSTVTETERPATSLEPAPLAPPPAPASAAGSTHPGFVEPPAALNQPTTYVVANGDHLWSIAANHLAQQTGLEPSTRQVAFYWRELIEHNRAALGSGDPDILHVGESLNLP